MQKPFRIMKMKIFAILDKAKTPHRKCKSLKLGGSIGNGNYY
jgi:hypothetical protein